MMKSFKIRAVKLVQVWNDFWFKPIEAVSMSVFRCCTGLVVLTAYLIRFFDIKIFFYESGLLSAEGAKAISQSTAPQNLVWILGSDAWLYFCYLSFIFLLVLLVLGVGGRITAGLAFLLHLLFIHRNPAVIYGLDSIVTFWLLYLVLSDSGRDLKWLNFFINKRKGLVKNIKADWFNTIACRLVQIQLCVVYMYSGFEKLKGRSWWEGTAIWEALSFRDLGPGLDFSFLLSWPLLAAVLSSFTVLFELYFPVLVWVKPVRAPLLWAGVLFHLMIGLFIGIPFFALIMLSAYVLFISPESLKRFFRRFER